MIPAGHASIKRQTRNKKKHPLTEVLFNQGGIRREGARTRPIRR
jgi:hypothetical protein